MCKEPREITLAVTIQGETITLRIFYGEKVSVNDKLIGVFLILIHFWVF